MPTINFPTGPTLNDEYSFGGKTWKYNGTAWELISTGITSTIRLHANAAFDAANTADQKGTSAGSYANGAFAKANTANTLAQAAFDAANSAAGTFAQASFAHANAAFDVANSASSYANGAFTAANTADQKAVTSGSYANGAFAAANTADQKAVSAGSYANGAFAAANSKLSSSGGTVSGDVTITGNLTVEGDVVTINVSTLAIEDSIIQLARNNTTNAVDIGFVGHYSNGVSNVHTGLIRHAADDTYYLFKDYLTDPSTVIDVANAAIATINTNIIASSILLRNIDPLTQANAAFASANTADQKAVSAGSYANGAFVTANTADQKAVSAGVYANAAFVTANTADQKAVTSGLYANSAYLHANAAFTAANNAVDTWVRDAANAASSYANSAFVKANSAFDNAAAASSYANGAFAAANTADQRAVTSGDYANSAFGVANSASSYANGAFTTANSRVLFTYSDTAPGGTPKQGDQWYEADSGILFTYINDGDTSQWVQLGV